MLVDTDTEFAALHHKVKEVVRTAERAITANVAASLAEGMDQFVPDELKEAMRLKFDSTAITLAECFLRGHFDVYRLISETIKEHEVLTKPKTGRVS